MIKEILDRTISAHQKQGKTRSIVNALQRFGLSERASVMVAYDILSNNVVITEDAWKDLETKTAYSEFKKVVEGILGSVGDKPDPKLVNPQEVLPLIHQKVESELRAMLLETGGSIDEISDVELPSNLTGKFRFIYSVSFPLVGIIVPSIIEGEYDYAVDKIIWTVGGKDVEFKETGEDLRKLIANLMEKVSDKVTKPNQK